MGAGWQPDRWRRLALWVRELGLAEGEELPVAQIEELADAVLVLLDDVARLRALPKVTANRTDAPTAAERDFDHDSQDPHLAAATNPPHASGDRLDQLHRALEEVVRERDEARAWARGYEHRLFVRIDTDHPPEWLTAPLETDCE